eukprot:TRINITY_DN38178_c0_g1_i1.p3 TRINITY_DN38178_c0_g1~~TRINITY_DN38178_c0_g1_i1.p3  ORF type:complete len:167 (+),score=28.29 TRINITY_DN38178_c0_g1_i1:157-657(+)
MHAHTIEALKNNLRKGAKALDIGFGSGFICAAFAELIGKTGKVYGVDHIQGIKDFAQENISKANQYLLDSGRVELLVQDGRKGLSQYGPYDVIHVGGAIESISQEIKDQLAPGGRLFAPVGLQGGFQTIIILDKDKKGKITEKSLLKVIYGMLGNAEDQLLSLIHI